MVSNYNEFESYLFDRKTEIDREWFFADDFMDEIISNELIVEYSSKVFCNIEAISKKYSDLQICLGLEYLINSACGPFCYAFVDETINETHRLNAINNMKNVFSLLFDIRCVAKLTAGASKPVTEYNRLCFMWWELLPRHGMPIKNSMQSTDKTILNSLEIILRMENIACKESALHGLGHWSLNYQEEVERIINQEKSAFSDSLKTYADAVISGNIM